MTRWPRAASHAALASGRARAPLARAQTRPGPRRRRCRRPRRPRRARPVARVAHRRRAPSLELVGGELGELDERLPRCARRQVAGGSTGASAWRSRTSKSAVVCALHRSRRLASSTISSSCRIARWISTFVAPSRAPERARDLAVVHAEGEAHDQRLAPVVRAACCTPSRTAAAPRAPRRGLGVVWSRRSTAASSSRRLRLARAVAVEVRREVVGDPDQPRAAAAGRSTRAARARSAGRPAGTSARSGPRRRGDCPPGSTSSEYTSRRCAR